MILYYYGNATALSAGNQPAVTATFLPSYHTRWRFTSQIKQTNKQHAGPLDHRGLKGLFTNTDHTAWPSSHKPSNF